MHLGWIWTDNLRPLVFEIALLAGYEFDDPDWIAVEHGMGGTDSEAGPWFEYQVGCVLVTAAFEPGANEMVSVKVDGATEAEAEKIRWLGNLMRNWHLNDASPTTRSRPCASLR